MSKNEREKLCLKMLEKREILYEILLEKREKLGLKMLEKREIICVILLEKREILYAYLLRHVYLIINQYIF